MTNTYRTFIASPAALYAAFNVQPSLEAALRIYNEETLEFTLAAADGLDRTALLAEAADVLYTVFGVLYACTDPALWLDVAAEFEAAMQAVAAKNAAKRPENGYGINGKGKITKIEQETK